MSFWDVLYAGGSILFSSLGGAGIVFAFSSWLGRVWADRIMRNETATHAKALEEVRAKYTRELESSKSELRKDVDHFLYHVRDKIERGQFVHRLQFEAEFQQYRELWSKVVEARDAAVRLRPIVDHVPAGKSIDEIKQERIQRLAKAFDEFQDAYLLHKPFLAPSVYDAVAQLAEVIHGEAVDYEYPTEDEAKYWMEAQKNAAKIREITDTICGAMRNRIGVLTLEPEPSGKTATP